MSSKPFCVGCMGAGQILNEAHLPAYASLESVELAAIYDPDQQRAASTHEHYFSLLKEVGKSVESLNVDVCDSPHAWQAGDQIIRALYAPFCVS